MIIKWRESEGVVHEWDWSGAPRTQEGRWIKERTGWTTKMFLDALEDLDPDAVIALLCVLAARDGRKLKWDEVDVDPVNDLEFIPTQNELDKVRELEAMQTAAAKGKGSLPPAGEIVRKIDQSHTGLNGSGALSAVALSPKSAPTLQSSGIASD